MTQSTLPAIHKKKCNLATMSQAIGIFLIVYVCGIFAMTSVEASQPSLEERIIELEKRDQQLIQIIQDQATKIRVLEKDHERIHDMSDTVKYLEDQNIEQKQVIESLQVELETVKKNVNPPELINRPIQPSEAHVNEHSQDHDIEANEVRSQNATSHSIYTERARKYLLNGAETVAFHATLSGAQVQHHAVGTPFAFTNVKLNVGGGYHPSTSLFIAPMSGIYIFSASIMSSLHDINHTVHAGIMKNGTYLAGIFAMKGNTTAEQGSVTIATQLSIGDEVWVQHVVHDDGAIYGGGLTSFMGCLVTPL